MKKTTIRVRTDINGNAFKLFFAIGLKPPPKVLSLQKKIKSCWHKLAARL
ncbi:MAG: hypothetical protein JXX14_10910 [Deltaproteobacteria bacterium]|nr:hypothetical protein [Deltaproteobacteria bacterium]